MLTPEGRRMLARLSRYNFVPSAQWFYLIIVLLVLFILWAWSVSSALVAMASVLGGVLVALFILGTALRKFEGMETVEERVQSAVAQVELEGEIARVSGLKDDYSTKL